jgi:quercetin dioxygenase-like cupin family protein
MKFNKEEGRTIFFRKTKMIFKATLDTTDDVYTTILMEHPPLVGPALHVHPNGVETFYVLKGNYVFTLNETTIEATEGDFVLIPRNEPHKYRSGAEGGQMLVTTPKNVEIYFKGIAAKLLEGDVPLEFEFQFAKENGQTFLDSSEHWGRS